MRRSHFIAALIIAASISTIVAISQHIHDSSRCSLDGSQIHPLYEVIIIQRDKSFHKFSCVTSAQIWFGVNNEEVSSILVTDEDTGKKINAEQAFYVGSEVVTTPHTGNKIHVFAQETVAKLHALRFSGKLVKNPFRVLKKKWVRLVKNTTNSPNSTNFILPSYQKPLCLASNTILIGSLGYTYISQKCFSQLLKGYSSPPDKPP